MSDCAHWGQTYIEWPMYSLGKAGTWGCSFSVGNLGRFLGLWRAMFDEAKWIIQSFEF